MLNTTATEEQNLIPHLERAASNYIFSILSASFCLYMCNLEGEPERLKFTDLFSCSSVISVTLGIGRSLFSLGTWREKLEDVLHWST